MTKGHSLLSPVDMSERDIDIELSANEYQEEEPGELDERTP
jgi:hypothetical protein